MRYVFWSGDSSIGIHWIDQNRDTLITVRPNWHAALMNLAIKLAGIPGDPRITAFEVHCHGHPAMLEMPGGNIDYSNVAEFGSLLKPMLAKGALIEILACKVASFSGTFRDMTALAAMPASSTPPAETQEYWDAVLKDAGVFDTVNMTAQKPSETYSPEQLATRNASIEMMRSKQLPLAGNGLEFCRTLARTSDARVRAAWVKQWEENTDHGGDIRRDFDRFGRWDGPVWEFLPSGYVKYLGFNPPREMLKFPEHKVGPQVAVNGRGMGARDSDGRLRPQRLNRAQFTA